MNKCTIYHLYLFQQPQNMHYTIKQQHIAKIAILLGLVLCISNSGYRIHELFLDNVTISFVDLEHEEAPENDTEDRTDSLEKEVEKDKIPSENYYAKYHDFIVKLTANQMVLQYSGSIHLELYTPPPEIS